MLWLRRFGADRTVDRCGTAPWRRLGTTLRISVLRRTPRCA